MKPAGQPNLKKKTIKDFFLKQVFLKMIILIDLMVKENKS